MDMTTTDLRSAIGGVMADRERVFICSPFGGCARNVLVAVELCQRAMAAGLAPFAPHALYPQWLSDATPEERGMGIVCGLAWLRVCDRVWALEVPPTGGMSLELDLAHALSIPVTWIPPDDLSCKALGAGGDETAG